MKQRTKGDTMKNKTTLLTIIAALLVVAGAFLVGPILNDHFGDKQVNYSNAQAYWS